MTIVKADNLTCPLDATRLERREKHWQCVHGHAFDIARQGYVNLLPVQDKRSKKPGDSKAMVAARTRFLNSGVYAPIAARLADICTAQIRADQSVCLLDAGCGDGYYSDFILARVSENRVRTEVSCIGLDISKAAIAVAAKRNKQIAWVVGTNRKPPVEAASVDLVFCVFGFPSFAGFADILKPGGRLVLVDPGPEHLRELRDIIYPQVRRSPPADLSRAGDSGFELVETQSLQFNSGTIDNRQINDLLVMTPYFYRAAKAGREAAGNLQTLALSVDVVIRSLEKRRS
jgi:23S rRNA (guanine745-N1)-methyltransferase